MDRIEPIEPSPPTIDTTRVHRVIEQRERPAARQQSKRRQTSGGREWDTDEQPRDDEEEQDGRHRIDVRA
jgi:hypothetical protein